MLEQQMQRLIPHLAQNRIHHNEQADCNGHGDPNECGLLKPWTGGGDEVSKDQTEGHGEKDPKDEEAVEEGEAAEEGGGGVGWGRRLVGFVGGG